MVVFFCCLYLCKANDLLGKNGMSCYRWVVLALCSEQYNLCGCRNVVFLLFFLYEIFHEGFFF